MHMYLEHLKQKKLRKSNSPLLQRFFTFYPMIFLGVVLHISIQICFSMYDMI